MRALVVGASLSAGLLAGGCGSGSDHLSKDEYVKKFKAASQQALTEGRASAGTTQPTAGADRAAAVLRRLAGRIAGLKAPKEVEEPQDQFVSALRSQATELDQAAAAYRSGNKKPLETIERRGGPSKDVAEREDKALEEFKEKGYRVATLD